MNAEMVVQCIDTHSCGEATRIVLGGIPPVPGATMAEKYDYFQRHFDTWRTALFQEPRGFENMLGAFLVPPTSSLADFGVIFAGATQYFEMCGDSTFSLGKALVETGMVPRVEPVTKIHLDTYGGVVEVKVEVRNGAVGTIAYRSVPAFFAQTAVVRTPSRGEVTMDIAFGGLWYGFVDARRLGIGLSRANMREVLSVGMELLRAVNQEVRVEHPLTPKLSGVALVTFYERSPETGVDYRVANVYGTNATCRSPAGTMSAARAAVSYSHGDLRPGGEMVIRNAWIGSEHRVRVLEETVVGGLQAIISELRATAHVTGTYQAVLEGMDPYKAGFLL